MAFAKRSRLRKPQLRTFTVLIRLLMPSAGPLVARRMIAALAGWFGRARAPEGLALRWPR